MDEVEIGKTYMTRISGKLVPVKIVRANPVNKGWIGVNLLTNRIVYVKANAKLTPTESVKKEGKNE